MVNPLVVSNIAWKDVVIFQMVDADETSPVLFFSMDSSAYRLESISFYPIF
jgi:hypothetical protein